MPIKCILTSDLVIIILLLALAMTGIAKAMIDLRGRKFFHGLALGLKRTQNH